MTEDVRDFDTTGMEEQLAHSQHLIDEAKVAAAELAESNPDPYETDAEAKDDEASGFESFEDGRPAKPGAVRAAREG
ncbi:hypothetical protein [Umezawaea sp. Da 62-37]|uniref:hypothetical protein n=1 Tax=Umezawaea sp. Da 62-37 TaxID=3075927 RepID=UPI0028F71376|nr:hypothetical protein [Umezawaea sp. Da 62-37]WNV85767.1 hypothetical protein RM788_47935 [Umezawaea sp. Da 62-37]